MKRYVYLFPFLLFFLAGCIELKTVVTVNNDGSGNIEETIVMSRELVDMFTQLSASFMEDSTGNVQEFKIFNEEELKEHASSFGKSVAYIHGEEINSESGSGYVALYSFKDINDIKINQNPGSKMNMSSAEADSDSARFVNFKFTKGTPSEIVITFPDFNRDSSADFSMDAGEDTASFNNLTHMLKDFSMVLSLKVNGTISETNATYAEAGSITLMNVSLNGLLNNKEKFEGLKNINPSDMQQVKDYLKDIEGMKIEFNNPVYVRFK